MLPNRIAVYLLCFAGVLGAIVPALADFDTSSVIGWVGGLAAIATAGGVFLVNWGKYEERTDLIESGVPGFAPGDDAPPAGR